MRMQARANPKTPPKPCPIQPRPHANPEAAIAAADRAEVRNAEIITTHPAAKAVNLARNAILATPPATIAAKEAREAKAAKAANPAAAPCQNPPS